MRGLPVIPAGNCPDTYYKENEADRKNSEDSLCLRRFIFDLGQFALSERDSAGYRTEGGIFQPNCPKKLQMIVKSAKRLQIDSKQFSYQFIALKGMRSSRMQEEGRCPLSHQPRITQLYSANKLRQKENLTVGFSLTKESHFHLGQCLLKESKESQKAVESFQTLIPKKIGFQKDLHKANI